MFGLSVAARVDLARRPTDMRQSFDGLAPLASTNLAVRTQAEFRCRRQFSLHSFPKPLDQPLPSDPAPGDDRCSAGADRHFLPVTILPDPILSIMASPLHLELILSNGRRIAVAPGFDPQTLRRLIAVVEGRPCLD
jgi:hypothetical protein